MKRSALTFLADQCRSRLSLKSTLARSATRPFATHGSSFPLSSPPPPMSPPHDIEQQSTVILPSTPPFPFNQPLPTQPFSPFLSPDRHCTIVGAPFAGGQPLVGVDLGPNFIRKGGLQTRLTSDGWRVHDSGDVDVPKQIDALTHNDTPLVKGAGVVGRTNELLHHACLPPLLSGNFLLTLGGDHSIAVGSISAILKARPSTGIVWIDAHADINTPYTSTSKNPHGMVVAFLADLQRARSTAGFEWMDRERVPLLNLYRDIVYIGLRDVDEGERAIIRHYNIRSYTMHDVDKYGIGEVMRRAIDHLSAYHRRPIHLSMDIDSIDPVFAPSTGTRVSGGLTYREAYYVCEALSESGLLCSMDMVEVNPSLNGEEDSGRTVQMAVGLIASAMGNKIL